MIMINSQSLLYFKPFIYQYNLICKIIFDTFDEHSFFGQNSIVYGIACNNYIIIHHLLVILNKFFVPHDVFCHFFTVKLLKVGEILYRIS